MTTIDPARAEHDTERQPGPPPRRSTATRGTRIIGIGAIVALGWLIAFGLGFSPADRDQLESVRILYVHVPTIWLAYLAFVVTAVSSAMYLFSKKKSLGWDRAAGASAKSASPSSRSPSRSAPCGAASPGEFSGSGMHASPPRRSSSSPTSGI